MQGQRSLRFALAMTGLGLATVASAVAVAMARWANAWPWALQLAICAVPVGMVVWLGIVWAGRCLDRERLALALALDGESDPGNAAVEFAPILARLSELRRAETAELHRDRAVLANLVHRLRQHRSELSPRLLRLVGQLADQLAFGKGRRPPPSVTEVDPALDAAACDRSGQDGLRLRCPPDWWQALVDELVSNARRHGCGPLTVDRHQEGRSIVLCWRNPAGNLDPELAARAVQPFWRFDDRDDNDAGFGLGLGVAAARCQALDGSLSCNWQDGHFQVVLRLPAA